MWKQSRLAGVLSLRNSSIFSVLLLLTSLLAIAGFAQKPPEGGSTQEPQASPDAVGSQVPTIRTQVDEVSLDISVQDARRNNILDLKPEDLVVTDNGTPVKLNGLHLVRGDSPRGHLVTLLFDPFSGVTARNARSAAEKVLKVLPSSGYSFSVLDIRGRLRLFQGFTDDRKAVGAAIAIVTDTQAVTLESTLSRDLSITTEKADPARNQLASEAEKNLLAVARTGVALSGAHVAMNERVLYQSLVSAIQESQTIRQQQHARADLAALLALVHSQQKLSERRAIVYFTHFKIMDSGAKEMLKAVSAAATRAGVTVYTIDLDALNETGQGQLDNAMLNGQPPFNPGAVVVDAHGDTAIPRQQQSANGIQGDASPTGPQWGVKQDIQMMTDFTRAGPRGNPFADTKSPIADLSKDTGGLYIDAQNSLKKPLQQMVEDLTTYYEATYVPPIKEYDGSFRSIAIKTLRPGLRVQSKTGYYAVAPGAEAGIRPFEVPLLKVFTQPQLPADVNFRASVLRFGELPDGYTNTVAIEVPFSELQVKQDVHTNLYSAHCSIVAQIKDSAGVVVEHFGDDLIKRGALESIDRDHSLALSLQRHFIAAPGKYTLEVVVNDPSTGKNGARQIAFEVPGDTAAPSLSDMVLVGKLDAVHEDDDDPLEPLRYETSKITPNISGQLPEHAKGVSLFFLLHPDAALKDPATLEMEVTHNGVPGRRTPLPLTAKAAQAAVPYLASFGSGALASGKYDIKAYFSQGGKSTQQEISFTVAGAQPGGPDSAAADGTGKSSGDAAITTAATDPGIKAPGQLDFTASKNAGSPMSKQEAQILVDDARQRAVSYNDSLPNFMCLEVTNRSVDPDGNGRWKLKDTIVELLRYRDKKETRTTLEVNGQASNIDQEAMKGALSVGEFGGVLKSVFADSSKAEFQWKETDDLRGGAVQVYDYRVDGKHSMFGVVGTDGRELIVGFHGMVYIDSATRSVRRITIIADDLPKNFTTHSSSLAVDYDYIAINDHDYLLPVSAEMHLTKGKHSVVLNTKEFRNYKRFGSNVRILGFTPVEEKKD